MPKKQRSEGKRVYDVIIHKKISQQWKKEVFHFRETAALYAERNGITEAQFIFQHSFSWIKYWRRKMQDKNFHSKNWGGVRTFKWSEEQKLIMWEILWNKCKKEPTSTIAE